MSSLHSPTSTSPSDRACWFAENVANTELFHCMGKLFTLTPPLGWFFPSNAIFTHPLYLTPRYGPALNVRKIEFKNLAVHEHSPLPSLFRPGLSSKWFPPDSLSNSTKFLLSQVASLFDHSTLSRFQYASPHEAVPSLYPPTYPQTLCIYRVVNQKVWPQII